MKKYVTALCIIASFVVIFIGMQSEVRWSGIATWAITVILLTLAAYYTKYIPEKAKTKKQTIIESE